MKVKFTLLKTFNLTGLCFPLFFSLSKRSLLVFLFGVLFLGAEAQTVQLGSGTAKSFRLPVYSTANYSLTQSIYTADELTTAGATAGIITKIRFQPGNTMPTTTWRQWTVYLKHISKAGFYPADKSEALSSQMIVFSGKIPEKVVAGEWIELTLEKPFEWNGTQNILLAVHESTPGKSPSSTTWSGYSVVPGPAMQSSLHYSNDIINPDPERAMTMQRTNDKPQFQLQFEAVCAGAPSAGNVPAVITNCAPFTLQSDGASEQAGIIGQWESSPEGSSVWTAVPGATNPVSTLKDAPKTPMKYRYRVTCSASGISAVSDVVETVIKPVSDCYCEVDNSPIRVPGSSPYFFTSGALQNVHTVEEPDSKSRYSNYTAYTISQLAGDSVRFATVINKNDKFSIWVDWNQDGYFNDEDELVYFGGLPNGGNLEAAFKVPDNALPGLTRMRIGKTWSVQFADPCSATSGFREDYTFEVVPRIACVGKPFAGNISPDIVVSRGTSLTVSVNGQSAGIGYGLAGQWEQKQPDDTHWTPLDGATGTAFRIQAVVTPMQYRFILTCKESGMTDTSDVTNVSLTALTYVPPNLPANNRPGAYIKRFYTYGGLMNINNHSGFDDYGDFTALSASQKVGQMVTGEAQISGGWRGAFSLSVDWNQDGDFVDESISPTEIIGDSIYRWNFYVPHFAKGGTTRLRIYYRNNNTFVGGIEAEDYSFIVIPRVCADVSFPSSLSAVTSSPVIYDRGEVNLNSSSHISAIDGLTFQWQSSSDGNTWTNFGAPQKSVPKKVPNLTVTTQYRVQVYCGGTLQVTSSPVTITVLPAKKIVSTTDGERCTPGSVTLKAYGDPGTVVNWYGSPTSSVPVFTGNEFTTPALSANKTYYAAVEMSSAVTGGKKTVGEGKYSTYAIRSSNGSSFNPFQFSGHTPFKTFFASKYQYLVRAEELLDAGIKPGNLQSLAFHVTGVTPVVFPNYTIGLKHTDKDAFVDGRLDSNVVNVFTGDITIHVGENTFWFDTPFDWDGVSNLVVSICNREQFNGHTATGGDVEYDMLPYTATGEANHGFWSPIICEATNHFSTGLLRYRPKMTFEGNIAAEGPRVPVYARVDAAASFATANSGKVVTQTPNVMHSYVNSNCEKLADIISTNNLGSVDVSVYIDETPVTSDGIPFVSRFYTVTPTMNLNSPSILTLYYSESEIVAYNNAVKNLGDTRFGMIDLQNPRSIRVYGYHGNINVGGKGPNGFDTSGVMIFNPTEVHVENGNVAITFTTLGFSGFFINGTLAGPLAIAMGEIRAANQANVNTVTWNTLMEAQGDIFVIERSTNGSNFQVIGTMAAKGVPSTYSFIDENPSVGYSYYRLALIPKDGSGKSYTKVVSAKRAPENSFRMEAYPNPASDITRVRISGDIGTNATLTIVDISGKKMSTINVVQKETALSVKKLLPGVYFFHYQDDVQKETLKVIKK